jgi:hypothetical protein
MTWPELHTKLAAPFPAEDVSFRPGQTSDKRAQALPYAEPRVYEDRLVVPEVERFLHDFGHPFSLSLDELQEAHSERAEERQRRTL